MSYLVLARKWRPRQFSEVIAQEHVTRTLENAIKQKRLASAYLFTGPRGVGKTTMARLLAKAVNCEKGPTTTPCDACSTCVEIAESRSLDVLEIDGASNRGIDEVRNLRENARYTPARGQYKIYIIDEVHMLTEPAFNALLKTLEEPPPHVMFIFATTEVHKVPATILSRCQRFDFRRVPLPEIVSQLKTICEKEGVRIDAPSLALIAKKAEGSMRDSQSLLDQVIAYCGQQVRREEVAQLFGIIDQDIFFACTDAIAQHDVNKGLELSDRVYTTGYHLGEFLDRLAEHFSHILTTRVTNSTAHLFGLDGYTERYRQTATLFSEAEVLRFLQMITEAQTKLSRVTQPRILLEMLFLKLVQQGQPTNFTFNAEDVTSPADLQTAPQSFGAQGGDSLKKKPLAVADEAATPGLSQIAMASTNELGIRLIPQVTPTASNDSRTSASGSSGPPRTSGSLFDRASLSGIQKVPVVQAKEPPIPQLTNVEDAKAALEKIQHCWARILEQVKSQRISLGAFLELGLPTNLSGGTLEICFDQGNGFQINSVNNQKTFIQEIIKRESGYRVRLVCRKEEGKSLQALRAEMQALAHLSGAARTETDADAMTPAAFVADKSGDAAGATKQSASAVASANGVAYDSSVASNQQPPASSLSVQELFQSYPLAKKLVEAVDGELLSYGG